jgi:hypothetical protein
MHVVHGNGYVAAIKEVVAGQPRSRSTVNRAL